jgi:hypothetical protein
MATGRRFQPLSVGKRREARPGPDLSENLPYHQGRGGGGVLLLEVSAVIHRYHREGSSVRDLPCQDNAGLYGRAKR